MSIRSCSPAVRWIPICAPPLFPRKSGISLLVTEDRSMAQELAYRMKREGEDEALFKLWSLHGGWGPTNPELWNYLMLRAPIVVAENPESGELLGQLAFLPALVSIRGHRVRALRAFAAILATKARQNRTLNLSSHPIADMYRFGLENLRPQGY